MKARFYRFMQGLPTGGAYRFIVIDFGEEEFQDVGWDTKNYYLVVIQQPGRGWLTVRKNNGFIHPSYLYEKVPMPMADAIAFAVLLNKVLYDKDFSWLEDIDTERFPYDFSPVAFEKAFATLKCAVSIGTFEIWQNYE